MRTKHTHDSDHDSVAGNSPKREIQVSISNGVGKSRLVNVDDGTLESLSKRSSHCRLQEGQSSQTHH